jgi:hypothetical protein
MRHTLHKSIIYVLIITPRKEKYNEIWLFNNTFIIPEVKQPGHGINHPAPSSAEVKERAELYIYSPLGLRSMFQGELFLITKSHY